MKEQRRLIRTDKVNRAYNRDWTEWELRFLADNWGLCSTVMIARRLRRSVAAIEARAHLLRFRRLDSFYTYTLLARELGMNRTTIRNYFNRGWLSGKKASWTYRYGKAPMMFMEEEIVKFLRGHYDLFNDWEIPNLYFRNVVKQAYEEGKR